MTESIELPKEVLDAYRARSFHLPPAARIQNPDQALDWVNTRGFAYFWPIKGINMPSLWVTVAGDRPVADTHDDPGHITWGWKDSALGKRRWYYAKMLRKKATLISLETAPYFYALTENYGSPEEDHLIMYEQGRLTLAAKLVYEALLKEGALNTIDLRKAARLTSKQSDSEFTRALEVLQADMKVLPVGVAEAGAWKYAFIYDLVPHHYPDLPEKARMIGEAQAREKLASLFFRSLGAAQARDLQRLFGWSPELTNRTLKRLVDVGLLTAGLTLPDLPGEYLALSELNAG
ncbi:MAG: winged helix DNA-binding domain-containing protein [Chloroflexi bacterium]|nr:winged helix DNA-binding domain-containing protein [Chloroflexota bacterium]